MGVIFSVKKAIFFSLIIPILNEEEALPALLASLYSQTFRNFEVIFVDGGSVDASRQLIRNARSSLTNMKLTLSKVQDSNSQRNLGVKAAKGAYYVFLEADCPIPSFYLDRIFDRIRKNKSEIITTQIANQNTTLSYESLIFLGNRLQELSFVLRRPYVGAYNTIVRKNVYAALNGFRDDVVISGDHDFGVRAFRKGFKVDLCRDNFVYFSFRRLAKEGYFRLVKTFVYVNVHFLIWGPLKKGQFLYRSGGNVHKRN